MKPIHRIFVVIVLAGVLCQLSFVLMKYEIDKFEATRKDKLSELLVKTTNYDLLFIGSSRTHLTVNPRIIDSVCGVSSYNAGIEGGNLFEFNMMLQAYLQNHPAPKWLVVTIDLHSFVSDYTFFDHKQYFSFTKNKVIHQYLNQNGHSTLQLKVFPFLEFTDYDDNTKGYFIKGLLGQSSIPDGDFQYKGYLSNTQKQIVSEGSTLKLQTIEVSASRKKCLTDMIATCLNNNIKLVFTYAPEYKHTLQAAYSNSNEVFEYVQKIADKNNIPFLRDDSLEICTNPKLFVNAGHLNRDGADVYSRILAEQLKKFIKE